MMIDTLVFLLLQLLILVVLGYLYRKRVVRPLQAMTNALRNCDRRALFASGQATGRMAQLADQIAVLLSDLNALQADELLYRSIANAVPTAVVQFDVKTDLCVGANGAFLALTGFTEQELTTISQHHLLTGAVDVLHERILQSAQNEQAPIFGIQCRRKDGVAIDVTVDLIDLPAVANACYALILRDESAEKAVERAFMDVIPDNFVRMNHAGDYLEARIVDEFPEMIPAKEMVGRNIYDVSPKAAADTIMRMIRQAVATREIVQYEYEREFAGQTHYLESRIVANGDDEIIAIVRDVTNRYQAEAMMRHQARLVESVSDAIVSVDLDLCITSWNRAAAELYGASTETVLGRPLTAIIDIEYVDSSWEGVTTSLLDNNSWQGEQIYRTHDGHLATVWSSITYIHDSHGTQIGMVIVSRNITAQKQAEQLLPLAQESESLKMLAGGIAHDFNNLLTSVLSHATLAADLLPAGDKAASHLHKALNATERIADLTRQLLAFTGQGAYVVETLNLNQMIQDNLGLLDTMLPKGITLTVELAPTIPFVDMDRGHAQQIIMNLLMNAGEAISADNGEISIATHVVYLQRAELTTYLSHTPLEPGHYVQFQISDNGVGMDATTRKRIFEPYFTTKVAGSGLGLAATVGIVDRYHGGIRVTSDVGQGTRFTLAFPTSASVAPPASQIAQTSKESDPDSNPSGKILIIDDEDFVREALGEILSFAGLEVVLAADGYKGIEEYRNHQQEIDLVLLDMMMPGLNGAQTLVALREFDPHVKVILCSGYSEAEVIKDLQGNPVSAFIQKPVGIQQMLAAIKTARAAPAH